MAIPYRTTKFKAANILAIAILGSTAKFNPRQYFRLYGMQSWENVASVQWRHSLSAWNIATRLLTGMTKNKPRFTYYCDIQYYLFEEV